MAFSCVTVMTTFSEESDALDGPNSGDTWGFGASFDTDSILSTVNDLLDKDESGFLKLMLGLGPGDRVDKSNYLDIINTLLNSDYDDSSLSFSKLEVGGEIWSIYEIIEKSSNGYVMDYALALSCDITVSANIVTDDETIILDDVTAGIYAYVEGKAYFDEEFALERIDSEFRISAQFGGKANVAINGDGEPHITKDLRNLDYYINLDGSQSLAVTNGSFHILPYNGNNGWNDDFDVRVAYSVNISTNINSEVNGHVIRDVEDIDSIEWKVIVREENGILYMSPAYDDLEDILDEIGIDLDIDFVARYMGEIYYTYPFEADTSVPSSLLVNGSLKLDQGSKNDVWDNINRIVGKADGTTDNLRFSVTFRDIDGNVLKRYDDVKYRASVDAPSDYDNKIMDIGGKKKMFVGWETDDGIPYNGIVTCDLDLKPKFVKVVTDKTPSISDVDEGKIGWTIDRASDLIEKALDNGLLDNGNTVYITITDESGKTLYRWSISAGTSGAGTGSIIPKITELEKPDKKYLNDVSDNRATLYLDFSASGIMPADTKVSYYVGDRFSDGSTVSIYYDNEEAGTADYSGSAVVRNGFIDIELVHCSSYMIVGDSVGSSDDGNTLLLIVGVAIAVIAVATVAFILISRKKNTA